MPRHIDRDQTTAVCRAGLRIFLHRKSAPSCPSFGLRRWVPCPGARSVEAMKALRGPAPGLEADVRDVVDDLFRRWPALLGFSVRAHAAQTQSEEIYLADLETRAWTAEPQDILGDVALALIELVDEEPAALELMRDRTFARTLH
jgi:hypothetical protein